LIKYNNNDNLFIIDYCKKNTVDVNLQPRADSNSKNSMGKTQQTRFLTTIWQIIYNVANVNNFTVVPGVRTSKNMIQ
jgi:hypothetical protein